MARRMKSMCLVMLVFSIGMLVYLSHLRQTQMRDPRTLNDFYEKTKSAIERERAHALGGSAAGQTKAKAPVDKDADGDIDEDDEQLAKEMADRLKAAEQQAKELANAKAPNRPDSPSDIIGVGSSAAGQKKKAGGDDGADGEETDEEHAVEQELERILKKSPVIVFSKSYCPYSKRAKGVLLEKYAIDPEPYVVELDTHPLGAQIQARLADMTGRKTVPNVMVNGKSIGGSDDIAELDKDKTLVEKIKSLGGKRVFEMKERFQPGRA